LSTVYDSTVNGSTQLVAAVTGQTVYICGYTIFANGTTAVEIDAGTGAACATTATKIVPAYQLQAQSGISDQSTTFRGLKTPVDNGLCLKTNAPVPPVAVQAIVYYAQF
jgi:hypothetical protein